MGSTPSGRDALHSVYMTRPDRFVLVNVRATETLRRQAQLAARQLDTTVAREVRRRLRSLVAEAGLELDPEVEPDERESVSA